MDSLRQRLKNATNVQHHEIEKTLFYEALRSESLPSASTLTYLQCLSILYATLEQNFNKISDPSLSSFLQSYTCKLPLLISDLTKLQIDKKPIVLNAVLEALNFANEIIKNSENQKCLLGYLYVLEGSQNGGSLLKKLFSKSVGVREEDLSYFGCYGSNTKIVWADFCQRLDLITLTDEDIRHIENTAVSTFVALNKIVRLIYPFEESSLSHHVTSFNPEAGNHRIPTDSRLIDIALRTGLKAWNSFPYLEERFGERGRRFTTSDSCWLMTLIPQESRIIEKNILWLRNVLASRGIPTVILQTHLIEIINEYKRVFPEKGSDTNSLETIVQKLASQGEELFSKQFKITLLGKVKLLQVADVNFNHEQLVSLLVSAKSDELLGIKNAYRTIFLWFAEKFINAPALSDILKCISNELENSQTVSAR